MSIYTVYRTVIWVPILVPMMVIAAVYQFGLPPGPNSVRGFAQVLGFSLLYGGLPYAALAAWATWWVGGRPEAQIRRLMYWAPILMLAVFIPTALAVGLALGRVQQWFAVALLGSVYIVPMGYVYVGLGLLLRRVVGPRPVSAAIGPAA